MGGLLNINCGIFCDDAFQAMPEYDSADIVKAIYDAGLGCSMYDQQQLELIDRRECDILIIPYIRGNFSDAAIDALVKFHADGGSLLFVGDLPHQDKWFPLKNGQASQFHLTRCYDDFSICPDAAGVEGLTVKGREIVGALPDPAFFTGKTMPGLRVTAFPPDLTYPLLNVVSTSHAGTASSVVVVERKCDKFLGAKLAVIGFIGGEPRENVDGAYQREWTFDPGLLTRRWSGIDHLVLKLIEWLRPVSFAAAIELQSLSTAGETTKGSILLKNLSDSEMVCCKPQLFCGKKLIWQGIDITIPAMTTKTITLSQLEQSAGIHQYTLSVNDNRTPVATATARIIPSDSVKPDTYGFSTYWSFREPSVPDEFKFFCDEMKQRGCQYLRANIPWEELEPSPGKYDWRITDDMLKYARNSGLSLQFWLFPTTRGSGLSDGGVPWWSLQEPAIDRYGNKGFFPSLWSPFYRTHYFAMVDHLTRRYANEKILKKFVLDFGNSDFPYGYYFYVNDTSLFDYSKFEQQAFALYLKEELKWDLDKISLSFNRKFKQFKDVPVPFVEETEPWRLYLDFRAWSINCGNSELRAIIKNNAPDKLPPDPPGHGLGSIADIGTYFYESKANHWQEERQYTPELVESHNFGNTWGGEPWQVGGNYRQYADALFQSVRLNADYFTIPGADLGLYGEDIARIGFVRRILAGAKRLKPELAIFDRTGWDDFTSLTHIGTRLDIPVDLISAKHRYDFSCYRLMTLPDRDFADDTMLLPDDESWYQLLRTSVEKGLNLLVFPGTCTIGNTKVQRTFLRQVFGLEDVRYGERVETTVTFPESFGGGIMQGYASSVFATGEVLLKDSHGRAILVRRKYGLGSVLLAGYDTSPESLDPVYNYEVDENIKTHTLIKLCNFLGIVPERYHTGNFMVYKEMIKVHGKEYFILLSSLDKPVTRTIQVTVNEPQPCAFDLASGEFYKLRRLSGNSYEFAVTLYPRQPCFMSFHDKFQTIVEHNKPGVSYENYFSQARGKRRRPFCNALQECARFSITTPWC
jgi:hypothetical protein